jgi:acylphosphatase
MSPPEEGVERAEIYVEGSRKMVDGFIRWCQKGDVGLSQFTAVAEILEEEPTGMYETFYVKTK